MHRMHAAVHICTCTALRCLWQPQHHSPCPSTASFRSYCCRSCCCHSPTAAAPPRRHPPIAATPSLPPSDFTYSQVSFAGGPISWPGRIHEGFSKLAAHLWLTGVQAAVDALVLPQGSSIQHVVVTGHSMGAGVSTLLSYTIQAGVCGVTDRGAGGTALHRMRVFVQGRSRLEVLHRAAAGSCGQLEDAAA